MAPPRIPERYGHFVFAVLQAGVTTCITAAVSSRSSLGDPSFGKVWVGSWLLSWALMVPIVLMAADPIKKLVRSIMGG
ncbi:DUF2798 domain-containing protein [Bradyrhizobium sp. Ash2021]|uniref:DUF2798 domain-containing protein n=1 Tax=Bradyrhizobium sp. Ash2021 TaxID=2954771 RepID=UPI002814F967|nr:DUF2798 domain-containing protein [Bradyrhizobium sp. Ash2021]WMT76344.1 DUF2798 domain-containing protein [Bradyrhizobium sp. Ash2021]WMT76451.1 DUF2798 domain-containing protein [Bradyrhizobium sp. Ash2021]